MAEKKSSGTGTAGADLGNSGKAKAATLYPIDELGAQIDPAVFAGVCEARRWSEGKMVEKSAFQDAVNSWLGGASDGSA